MDNGYATLRCVLKVNRGCDACMRHAMEIAGSIVGVYEFTLDLERNRARISALVDPNFCMKAIARCNGHAQVLWANLSHPKMRQSASYGHDYGYGYESSSNYIFPDENIRSLPEAGWMWHDYPTTSYQYNPCSSSSRINYLPQPHQYSYPYPPPNPVMDYYNYGGDDYSLCSIM